MIKKLKNKINIDNMSKKQLKKLLEKIQEKLNKEN